jgi:alcohol dehydrogenase (cytochrome c)
MFTRTINSTAAILLVCHGTVALAQLGEQRPFTRITDEILNKPSDADWPQYRRTHANWGFSPLDQIDKRNVSELRLVWSRAIRPGTMEMTPLVYQGVMYIVHPASVVEAVDATTGDLIWSYERSLPSDVNPSGTMRNLALYDDKVYYVSRDGYLIALNAVTGAVVWETRIGGPGISNSSGPIAANGVIVTGRGCAIGVVEGGCYILGHDALTGTLRWRVNTTAKPGEPGGDTWGDVPAQNRWHVSPWLTSSFDPELSLIYMGTGVPGPYPSVAHGRQQGDALYSNSTLAIEADTGKLVWFYQHLPGDEWDVDHTSERILIDTTIAPSADVRWANLNIDPSRVRKVVWAAGKAGTQFVLDRTTGEFLWATPMLHQNIITDIEPGGRVIANAALRHREIGDTIVAGPRAGKNWWAGAYSPLTNAVYQPLFNAWLEQTYTGFNGRDVGASRTTIRSPERPEAVGMVKAYSVRTGSLLWEHLLPSLPVGGLAATGGGLVFGGDWNRRFRAFDDTTGVVLWEVILNSRVSGGAISYAVDGVQYIAVGTGGGSSYENYIDLRPQGLSSPTGGSSVFVFALPPALTN